MTGAHIRRSIFTHLPGTKHILKSNEKYFAVKTNQESQQNTACENKDLGWLERVINENQQLQS